VKELLETSKPVRISLFFLTIVATAMVISDACLTPAISVLSAVGGLKEKAPNLTTGTAGARVRTYVLAAIYVN
jgi:KUP system potassium uptake protein